MPQTRRTAPHAAGAVAHPEPAGEQHEPAHPNGGLRIPVPHLSVTSIPVHLPKAPHVAVHRPHLSLSSPAGRVLWLGGLATVAAAGAIDWPVAVAVAAGTYIAEQRARALNRGK
jgi:hypothetical protein